MDLNGIQSLKPRPIDCRLETNLLHPIHRQVKENKMLSGCFVMQHEFSKNRVIDLDKQNHVLVLHLEI